MSHVQENELDDATSEKLTTRKSDRKTQQKLSRDLRRKARESLRSRAFGLGVSVSSNDKSSAKKSHVVFGDEDNEENDLARSDPKEASSDSTNVADESGSENDDDSAVEEVNSKVARQQAMDQRAIERETAKIQNLHSLKTKKRKQPLGDSHSGVEINEDNAAEELDEEFFAQVDAEINIKRQKPLEGNQIQQPTGRHTTFVSAMDDATNAALMAAEHNIELVVLGNAVDLQEEQIRKLESKMGTTPSTIALSLSRSRLVVGDEAPFDKGAKKGTTKTKRKDTQGWKRSRKMNRVTSSRVRLHRRGGRGAPAAHFVKKT